MAFLSSVFTEKDYSKEEQEKIISKFKATGFKKNDFLIKEGKTTNAYWFIETGFARSYVIDTEGNDISTNFFSPGDIAIDWPSFFLRIPTRENIQALTDCQCWEINFEDFQELFHSIQTFREQGRARLVGSYFALKTHTISMIADLAKDRYRKLEAEKPLLLQNVSLKQLATYLGITDTSLSRIRKELSGK